MPNNGYEDWMALDENSFLDEYKKKQANTKELKEQWAAVAKKFVQHKWIYRYITDKQREMLDKYYKSLTDEDVKYGEYTKAFKFICRFMGLPADKTILENLLFKRDTKDKEMKIVAVMYSKGAAKVKIPEGVRLVHVSPAEGITELIPSFRSKVKGRYMYPSKRVFFTVEKEIPKNHAGLEKTKTHRYTPKQEIHEAWIDPTYATYKDSSVFVETANPIPVEPYERAMENLFEKLKKAFGSKENVVGTKKSEEEKKPEGWDKKNESAVVLEDGYYAQYDMFDEGVLSNFIGTLKTWKTSNQAHSKKVFKDNTLSDEDYEKLNELIHILTTEEDYKEYKKAFDKFCRFCHIVPRGTIICKYDLKKGTEGKNNGSIYVEYSENTKKMQLPEGLKLFHMTTVAEITELKPFFRGKSQKGYLYDKPRVYFTVNENMPKFLADYKITDKVHKYKCKSNITSVYVDPLVWANIQGAVYVETNKPIPVEEVGKPSDKPSDTEENKKESEESKKEEAALMETVFEMDDSTMLASEGYYLDMFKDAPEIKEVQNIYDYLDKISAKSNGADVLLGWFKKVIEGCINFVIGTAAPMTATGVVLTKILGIPFKVLFNTFNIGLLIIYLAFYILKKIYYLPGSLTDKRKKCAALIQQIDKAIAAAEERGDKKLYGELLDGRAKAVDMLLELDEKANKHISLVNNFKVNPEAAMAEFVAENGLEVLYFDEGTKYDADLDIFSEYATDEFIEDSKIDYNDLF